MAFKCTNAQAGTFNHECGKPATWLGTKKSIIKPRETFSAAFCDWCKDHGDERHGHTFNKLVE